MQVLILVSRFVNIGPKNPEPVSDGKCPSGRSFPNSLFEKAIICSFIVQVATGMDLSKIFGEETKYWGGEKVSIIDQIIGVSQLFGGLCPDWARARVAP